MTITGSPDAEKVQLIRDFMPGFCLGVTLTPFMTDEEVLEWADLKDQRARIDQRLGELERFAKNRQSAQKSAEQGEHFKL